MNFEMSLMGPNFFNSILSSQTSIIFCYTNILFTLETSRLNYKPHYNYNFSQTFDPLPIGLSLTMLCSVINRNVRSSN